MELENYLESYINIKHFIIPGLGNSDQDHWQTRIEYAIPNSYRINQDNWNEPDVDTWINKIDSVLKNEDLSNVILIGHSLGCITIARWAFTFQKKVKGALLVAPADIENYSGNINRPLS